MSWAQRRRVSYIGGFFAIVLIVVIIFAIRFLSKPATCTDGVQNQGEVGIDCGGPCINLCRAQYSDPVVLWTRWSKVTSSGTYNLLAYIQNPNIDAGALNVPYNFKLYDKDGVLLFEKAGITYIPPSKSFAIFEDGININDKVPARVDLIFPSNTIWQRIDSKELSIVSVSKNITKEDSKPRVDAMIQNTSLLPIKNIDVIAILYSADDNAIAFSRTNIDLIQGGGTVPVVFTWPEPLSSKVYKIEIVPKVLVK
jgi:hypothetical protein